MSGDAPTERPDRSSETARPDDIPPWHPYDGCHGCRQGNASGRRAVNQSA